MILDCALITFYRLLCRILTAQGYISCIRRDFVYQPSQGYHNGTDASVIPYPQRRSPRLRYNALIIYVSDSMSKILSRVGSRESNPERNYFHFHRRRFGEHAFQSRICV